jgi:hypothetical protein
LPSPERIAAALGVALALVMNDASSTPAPESGVPAAREHASLAARLPLLAPKAIAWAQALAAQADLSGHALSAPLLEVARRAGVREPRKVRIVVVDEIPLPEDPALKGAALSVGLSQSDAAGMTLGHAVFLRRGYENDLRVTSHELRHVAQYEACGGISGFLSVHLADLVAFGYEDSPFEVDARAHEVAALPTQAKARALREPLRRDPHAS